MDKSSIVFFEEELVPEAEGVLRLYLILSLDLKGGRDLAKNFFRSAVELIPMLVKLGDSDRMKAALYAAAYQFFVRNYQKSGTKSIHLDEDLSFLTHMKVEDRLFLFLSEFVGLDESGLDFVECDRPNGGRRAGLDVILKKVESFEEKLGEAQLFFQGFQFELDEIFEIKNFVRDSNERHTEDFQRIEGISKWQVVADFSRRVILFVLVFALGASLFFYFKPGDSGATHSIDTLRFEVGAFQEYGKARIDVAFESLKEQEAVLKSAQNLVGFTVRHPIAEHPKWKTLGSSILDYDTHKIVALVWSRKDNPADLMIVFQFLADNFDPRPENNQRFERAGMVFTPYVSENSNILMWPTSSSTFGVVFGTSSANDLADFIKVVLPTH